MSTPVYDDVDGFEVEYRRILHAKKRNKDKRICVFNNPRSRSNLFSRMLRTHPDLRPIHQPFIMSVCFGPDHFHHQLYDEGSERSRLLREEWDCYRSDSYTLDKSEADLRSHISDIESRGKIPAVCGHCNLAIKPKILLEHIKARTKIIEPSSCDPNPTLFPDDIWNSTTPILLIRHPALALPSYFKGANETPGFREMDPAENLFWWSTSLTWSRLIFDTLRSQGRDPIVLDGEDLCTRTDEVIEALCERLALDPAGISQTWEKSRTGTEHPIFELWIKDLTASNGIKKHEAPAFIDTNKIARVFEDQYGPDQASRMRTAIQQQMENYQFLSQFKI